MVTIGSRHPVQHRIPWRSVAPVAASALVVAAVTVGFVLVLARVVAALSAAVTGW